MSFSFQELICLAWSGKLEYTPKILFDFDSGDNDFVCEDGLWMMHCVWTIPERRAWATGSIAYHLDCTAAHWFSLYTDEISRDPLR